VPVVPSGSKPMKVHPIMLGSDNAVKNKKHVQIFERMLDELGIEDKFTMAQTHSKCSPMMKTRYSVKFLQKYGRFRVKICDTERCVTYVVKSDHSNITGEELYAFFLAENKNKTFRIFDKKSVDK